MQINYNYNYIFSLNFLTQKNQHYSCVCLVEEFHPQQILKSKWNVQILIQSVLFNVAMSTALWIVWWFAKNYECHPLYRMQSALKTHHHHPCTWTMIINNGYFWCYYSTTSTRIWKSVTQIFQDKKKNTPRTHTELTLKNFPRAM